MLYIGEVQNVTKNAKLLHPTRCVPQAQNAPVSWCSVTDPSKRVQHVLSAPYFAGEVICFSYFPLISWVLCSWCFQQFNWQKVVKPF